MARLPLPPPVLPPNPLFFMLQSGEQIVRIYDPTSYGATPLSFRKNGPRLRFDHQRLVDNQPANDPERDIYYAGRTLSCCIVETFGDDHILLPGERWAAYPRLMRDLRLLDLRGNGAMRAGTIAALAKVEHEQSQVWSRYFYETSVYQNCDGLIYANAHNDEDSFALYERAEKALECPPGFSIRLDDINLRPELLRIAQETHIVFQPVS